MLLTRSDDAQPGHHAALGMGEHVDGHTGFGRRHLGEQGREPVGGELEDCWESARLEVVDGDVVEIRVGVEHGTMRRRPAPPSWSAAGWIGIRRLAPAVGEAHHVGLVVPERVRVDLPRRVAAGPGAVARAAAAPGAETTHDDCDATLRSGTGVAVDDGVQSFCCSYQRRIVSTPRTMCTRTFASMT